MEARGVVCKGMSCKNIAYCPGYLTVYLALVMAIMLSLYLALIEGARNNAIKLEAEIITDIGMNSILAEYHRELYRQYNLFAIDTSYGTINAGHGNVEEHLKWYLERNLSYENIFLSGFLYKDFMGMSIENLRLSRVSNLTDGRGAVFRKRAVEAIRDDVGITLMESLAEWMKTVEDYELTERDIAAEKKAVDDEIEEYDGEEILISEAEWGEAAVQKPDGQWTTERVQISEAKYEKIEIENPTDKLEEVRKKGILELVVEDAEQLSIKGVELDSLIAARMETGNLSRGNWNREEDYEEADWKERFFFQEYLLKYLGRYGSEKEEGALQYQMEYIISGKDNDVDNLRRMANTLCAIREVANAVYLMGDNEKCAVAGGLATLLATLMLVPQIADLLQVTLLLGWSYAESLHDVKLLLGGERVPLLKDDSTWYYDLDSALDLKGGTEKSHVGLSYEDYLRILMSLKDVELLTERAMNMVEADIRQTAGNSAFRLDACYDGIEAVIEVKSSFGYEYEITRKKQY